MIYVTELDKYFADQRKEILKPKKTEKPYHGLDFQTIMEIEARKITNKK